MAHGKADLIFILRTNVEEGHTEECCYCSCRQKHHCHACYRFHGDAIAPGKFTRDCGVGGDLDGDLTVSLGDCAIDL